MTAQKAQARVIYFDDNNGYGYAAATAAYDERKIDLFYFDLESFEYSANRSTSFDRRIECELVRERDASETRHLRNNYVKDGTLREPPEDKKPAWGQALNDIRIIDPSKLEGDYAEAIKKNIESNNTTIIFRGIEFHSPLDLKGITLPKDCWPIFINCIFHDIFVLPDANFDRSISFFGCMFKSRFSMKGCQISGDVNLESCYFKGKGGVSFKGLKCRNLYMDRDTVGPDDEVWFNCARISGILSLAGSYYGNVFMEAGASEPSTRINSFYIGHISSRATAQVKTSISGGLVLKKAEISDGIKINLLASESITIENTETSLLLIENSHIRRDIKLDDLKIDAVKSGNRSHRRGMLLENSRIDGHLSLLKCVIDEALSFKNSVVGSEAKIQDCKFKKTGILDVYGFIVDRLRILPANKLFGGKKTAFSNPKFWLLKRQSEQKWILPWLLKRKLSRIRLRRHETPQDRREQELQRLHEEYLSFKHWFSESGDLYMEDASYYNMRHYNETSIIKYLFFNFCFGWGVRLWNVLFTALTVIGIYTGIYVLWNRIESIRAVVFSIESFFFGAVLSDWSATLRDADKPLSGLAILSMSEGAIGVLLITVLIGAYMRKLLR